MLKDEDMLEIIIPTFPQIEKEGASFYRLINQI